MNSLDALTEAQAALADYDRVTAARLATRSDLEKTIAATEKTLADLEEGIGAPKDVPSWLARKNELRKRRDTARTELSTLNESMIELGRTHRGLVDRVEVCIRGALIVMSSDARAKLTEALANAAKAAAEVMALDLYFRKLANAIPLDDPAHIQLHRLANDIPPLPNPAVRGLLECGTLSDPMIEWHRRRWEAIADELRNPKTEETTVQQAAE